VLGPWSAAALPEIMAGALQESKRGVHGGGQTGEQQASNREAQPGREAVELGNPTEAYPRRVLWRPGLRHTPAW